MKPRLKAARQRGLTLLELLLTLVIFSFVIGIFSQALFQISQFSIAASRTTGLWQQRWITGFGLDDYFSSLSAPSTKDGFRTTGTSSEFSTSWVEQSGPQAGRPVRVTLSLRALTDAAQALPQTAAAPVKWALLVSKEGAPETVAARWNHSVSFRYLDSGGTVWPNWPAASGQTGGVASEALPRAVWAVDSQNALAHAWYFGASTQPSLAGRRDLINPAGGSVTP